MLSNMGDKCKIFEKDGWLFAPHYFTNSAENTFVVSADNSWWTHLQKLRDVDIIEGKSWEKNSTWQYGTCSKTENWTWNVLIVASLVVNVVVVV